MIEELASSFFLSFFVACFFSFLPGKHFVAVVADLTLVFGLFFCCFEADRSIQLLLLSFPSTPYQLKSVVSQSVCLFLKGKL